MGTIIASLLLSAVYSLLVISVVYSENWSFEFFWQHFKLSWLGFTLILTIVVVFFLHFAFGKKPLDPYNTSTSPEQHKPYKYMGYMQRLNLVNGLVAVIIGVYALLVDYGSGMAIMALGLSVLFHVFNEGKGNQQTHKHVYEMNNMKEELNQKLDDISKQIKELQKNIDKMQKPNKK